MLSCPWGEIDTLSISYTIQRLRKHRDESPFIQMSDFPLRPVPLPDISLLSPPVLCGLCAPIRLSQLDLNIAFCGLTFDEEYMLQPLAQHVTSLEDSQLRKLSMFNGPISILVQADDPLDPDQQHKFSSLRLRTALPNISSVLHLTRQPNTTGTRLRSSTSIATPRYNRSALRAQSFVPSEDSLLKRKTTLPGITSGRHCQWQLLPVCLHEDHHYATNSFCKFIPSASANFKREGLARNFVRYQISSKQLSQVQLPT